MFIAVRLQCIQFSVSMRKGATEFFSSLTETVISKRKERQQISVKLLISIDLNELDHVCWNFHLEIAKYPCEYRPNRIHWIYRF